jgi:hypothetical protein
MFSCSISSERDRFPYWARNELAWVGEAIELGFTGSLPSITS